MTGFVHVSAQKTFRTPGGPVYVEVKQPDQIPPEEPVGPVFLDVRHIKRANRNILKFLSKNKKTGEDYLKALFVRTSNADGVRSPDFVLFTKPERTHCGLT